MKRLRTIALVLLVLVVLGWALWQTVLARHPARLLVTTLTAVANLVEPAAGTAPQTVSARLAVLKAEGFGDDLQGRTIELAYQAPDRAHAALEIDRQRYVLGRDGQTLWIHAPGKRFGLIGQPGVARFLAAPEQLDTTQLPPFRLPVSRKGLLAAPLLMSVERLADATVDQAPCRVLRVTPRPQAARTLKLPPGQLTLWVRQSDSLPVRAGFVDGRKELQVELQALKLGSPWPEGQWRLPAATGDKVETVAVSHLVRFFPAALTLLDRDLPTLGPAKGERRVVATEGRGRLEIIDDTQVLVLKGSPAEMGHQHAVLARQGVHDLVNRVLYGVGIGSSFDKGRWFFGEIQEAQARLLPFTDAKYLEEMDALAQGAGLHPQEIRLANFFPELFHCSGFALFGQATVGGRIYHGRILDYMRGIGLERNAMVIVHQPDDGHAWVNVGYAGFVGSVTAMNDQHISLGEMGGRGEGHWDGKPMAQLIREVMENASTLEEAIAIMRRGPRTCEYFYVIADGKAHSAVGIAATPDTFEVIRPGEAHPRLPHPSPDTVLMSAGDRYEKLAERVKEGHGKFDDESARRLMDRPVAMKSNIHSALFAPDTLDFWVANADNQNPASHTRYTHYNLAELCR